MSKVKLNFDTLIAKEIGTDSAIIFSNIEFWVATNKANQKNFFDGNYWTYNSIKAFCELFDWLTESQIKTCLTKLEKYGYIHSGNYNKVSYDRTKWYSIPEKTTIGENSQMDLLNIDNRINENSQPIPDNNTDNKKSISEKIDFDVLLSFYNQTFSKRCSVFPLKAKKYFNDRLKEGYSKVDIKNVLLNVSQDSWHIEKEYKVATLEFLSRSKTFEMYASIIPKSTKNKNQEGHTNY